MKLDEQFSTIRRLTKILKWAYDQISFIKKKILQHSHHILCP